MFRKNDCFRIHTVTVYNKQYCWYECTSCTAYSLVHASTRVLFMSCKNSMVSSTYKKQCVFAFAS